MIAWQSADTWPAGPTRAYLIWVERADDTGLGLPAACDVFRGTVGHDLGRPVPHPDGVGVDFPRAWAHHPTGLPLKAGCRVTHWAEFNRPDAPRPLDPPGPNPDT